VRGILIRVGLVAGIIVIGLVIRPFVTGNAGDLAVGDCFDPPSSDVQTVKDVQHHPCSEPHGGEVFFVDKMADQATFPDEDTFNTYVSDHCLPAYQAYTGVDVLTEEGADIGWLVPTEEGWGKGDREVTCYATRLDNAKTTGSVKKQ
jgi:hypothetical protein